MLRAALPTLHPSTHCQTMLPAWESLFFLPFPVGQCYQFCVFPSFTSPPDSDTRVRRLTLTHLRQTVLPVQFILHSSTTLSFNVNSQSDALFLPPRQTPLTPEHSYPAFPVYALTSYHYFFLLVEDNIQQTWREENIYSTKLVNKLLLKKDDLKWT